MSERLHCCVPFCSRTTRPERGFTEWVCGKHWPLVSRRRKRAYSLTKRRVRKIVAKRPEYREYWKLPPGSPSRISAVSVWRRLDDAWDRCKREAIERAGWIA